MIFEDEFDDTLGCYTLISAFIWTQVSCSGEIRLWQALLWGCGLHIFRLRLTHLRYLHGLAGGRGIIVAMITMAAPQAGHVMGGRCFNFPASQRNGLNRRSNLSRLMSFLLHEWTKPYDLARRKPLGSTWSMSR